jgi:hypothetical protein
MHTEVVGEIYRGAAGLLLLSKKEFRFKSMVEKYKKLLRASGKELVQTGRIGADMTASLEQPLINADEYAEYANKMWDQILAERNRTSPVLTSH